MKHRANHAVIAAMIIVVFNCMACSEDNGTEPNELQDCTGQVTVSVTVGDEVVIDWEPACRLFFLNIEPVGSGRDMWHIVTDSVDAIAPPVTYGIVPDGAVARDAASELLPGVSYNVYLFRWTGPGKQAGELAGQGVFTR